MSFNANNALAALLVRKNLLDESLAKQQAVLAAESKLSFIHYLYEKGNLDSKQVQEVLSESYGIPTCDLSDYDYKTLPDEYVNEKLIAQHHVVPYEVRGNRLFIALADPTNLAALEDFQFSTGIRTEALLADVAQLAPIVETILEGDVANLDLDSMEEGELDGMEVAETERKDDGLVGEEKDDAPIVVYINKLLMDAIRKGASDLHFEPYEKSYRVRFRIDGILHEISSPPVSLSGRLSARLKVMSKLDIAERRVPQDGRIKLRLSRNKSIDFRVSTLPTIWGEKVVLRILDSSSAMLGIDVLGYEQDQKDMYMAALGQPQGMILVTGPTGSGKTVSLYTGLNILNTPERNIATAEDPVEINLTGVNQVHMNPKAGLTFSSALRSFLRQDPDIVMVGEIRDLETAEIAIKAAQTGHLVLSTLHTNSAPETLTRLLNMGVPSFNVASSVTLIIAQRLGRKLCGECKAPEVITSKALKELGFNDEQISQNFTVYKPVGCDKCTGGYKGRVGVYEVMKISDAIAKIIMEEGNSLDIAKQAELEGVDNLRKSALKKVMAGLLSLSEVERITSF
ncbi:type IV-A pilus assembly ATPase PilB [Corallincola holothuriorum]|uniref:Type IV-A pilus assembly ATPase PilB n=1 Tax=Corallincola holothuriorum TaxID=2282215 RepID=A0A368NKP5_9GAMM|nr:type IV-A pilus assembly ATPase PilB [Corallincola holothuriorum]RCU49901.1 type IV-A pilus assembly ATPase PilB [Corallincola holothuriorum]